ncbi:unnamed protein product [Rotaria magnacalcarata]|uniref:RRM domain-containing protein n=1 Tax=Rotaria magnacalcarata TaxID=392030 RepID=A0A816SJ50_9BILA|nr:unnamed protein product [Rotaria magnacalcarata]CAF1378232.1 unnamed protein product [Rotaria magnacalcarata]CAF1997151.1 unnamed protein product [Rotaria magnacalcarata]CAF2085682.1 unnamed protein product [Rotaria magnacalcarata]CAF3827423.1 unnamed protein product [Rotaria magnacalcarata]
MPHRSTSRGRHRSRSPHRERRRHNRDRSPVSSRRDRSRSSGHEVQDDIERLNPTPSNVLGVFGLSSRTEERDVRRIFSKFGRINNIHIVYDRGTGRSRGFGFIYYDRIEDATAAKRETHGMDIDGQKIRVDFSLTDKPHDRTPGIYMGVAEARNSRNDYRSSRRHRGPSRSPRRRSRS